jgi:hypothetical protein
MRSVCPNHVCYSLRAAAHDQSRSWTAPREVAVTLTHTTLRHVPTTSPAHHSASTAARGTAGRWRSPAAARHSTGVVRLGAEGDSLITMMPLPPIDMAAA